MFSRREGCRTRDTSDNMINRTDLRCSKSFFWHFGAISDPANGCCDTFHTAHSNICKMPRTPFSSAPIISKTDALAPLWFNASSWEAAIIRAVKKCDGLILQQDEKHITCITAWMRQNAHLLNSPPCILKGGRGVTDLFKSAVSSI